MVKTYNEINQKIKNQEAIVMTAEEIISIVKENGIEKTAKEVDIVTTATFGPMCSSGAFVNVGHANPKMKIQKAWFNDVPAYCGLAAVDMYIGATELQENDPANNPHPGRFLYGGGHVIHDLIAGKDVHFRATGYGTDCYPRKELETWINIGDMNEVYLCNPRNCYQNYNVAVNVTDKTVYTYMGVLKPRFGNANYCSAGQLSPLLNDPLYRTIGIGTRIWLAGTQGYVYWQGTQHSPSEKRNARGLPLGGAGTLAVIGDAKEMNSAYVVGTSLLGYGVNLTMGIGVPIPILDEDTLKCTTVTDADIQAPVVDYGYAYPNCESGNLGLVSYEELKSGMISIGDNEVPTASMSSYPKAVEIATTLKKEIEHGTFFVNEPIQSLQSEGLKKHLKSLKIRKKDD